jgi:hypothetical protein
MWQNIIVHIIVILAAAYSIYNGVQFFMPGGSKMDDSKCPGCSGGCSTNDRIDLSQLKQIEK